jgi:hypothetical protein
VDKRASTSVTFAHEPGVELGGDEILGRDRASENGPWVALSSHRVPLGPAGRSLLGAASDPCAPCAAARTPGARSYEDEELLGQDD